MSSTRLSAFCSKVMETGWLLAVIITPVFFNVYSSRVFEPDKLTTLRTVALIMAAAWITRYIEERLSGRHTLELTWRTPLLLPTLFTVVVYLLSTIFSVTPRVSLLGSYQRLQGTYTTLSYIVVFLIILQEMRTREQLDRLVTVMILNSLPISLYGLLQRNRLDPLPWGGDVTVRVASNMGNPIFVAAYLIMITPPTLARILSSFRSILTNEETGVADILRAATYIFILLVQLIATFYTQSRGPLMGLLAGLGIWGFLELLMLQQAARREHPFKSRDLLKDLGRGVIFGMASLGAAGLVAAVIYFVGKALTGAESQLPQGLAALGAVLTILGSWLAFVVGRQGWRWLWSSVLVMALCASAGFFAVNPGGPLNEWARQQPSLSRVTNVLNAETGTGMVRNLIWQGGLRLFLPQEPLRYPPTSAYPNGHVDPFNAIRLLVGYGPESMYVAYNPFYPPLLGHYEQRTASPDRSHNETLDSLIITGLPGFVAYLWVFGGIFYFGLRWLGLLPSDWRRTLFFTLLVTGAVIATAIVVPRVGTHFFCLAIPIGIVGGLFVYLLVYAFSVYWDKDVPQSHPYAFVLIGILSAVVAHFIEINFGIAIASTRTTFWACAGAFVVAGAGMIRSTALETRSSGPEGKKESPNKKRRRKREPIPSHPPAPPPLPAWIYPTLIAAIVSGFLLGTLAFDFVTNAERLSQPLRIIWRALTVLPAQQSRTSYGALMIFVLTWVAGGVVHTSEMVGGGVFRERKGDSLLAFVVHLLISLAVGFSFALVLAGKQAALMGFQAQSLQDVLRIAERVAGFLTAYYWFIIFVLLAGGTVLYLELKQRPREVVQPWGAFTILVLTIAVGGIATVSNLQPVKADIVYKQGEPYDRGGQWLIAIEHYKRAIELAPREDFYYLYLGRAYLEYASSIEDPAVRESLLRETERVLLQARELNPLNTDHSANLARMYRRWADLAGDENTKRTLLQKSSENYALATTLSPNNAILWNEWAMLYYYGMGDVEGYERALRRSLELDPDFDQTWLVCGDVNRHRGNVAEAIHCYEEALRLRPSNSDVWRALGDTYIAAQQWEKAIHALTRTLELQPKAQDAWNVLQVIARLYSQLGQQEQALLYARQALEVAPDEQHDALEGLVAQIQQIMEASQP